MVTGTAVPDTIESVPWCLDPTDPELLGLAEVDGNWYAESQAHTLHLKEEFMEDFYYEIV